MIVAIETRYAGCRFRSRLEARWAVFFDQLGITWEYEPEGLLIPRFDLDTRRNWTAPYLPDFRLSDGTLVEVKGHENALDQDLLYDVAVALGGGGVLVLGPIPNPPEHGDLGWTHLMYDRACCTCWVYGGSERCKHVREDQLGFGMWPSKGHLWFHCDARSTGPGWLAPTIDPDECDVSFAYVAARSARFEHGESGALR